MADIIQLLPDHVANQIAAGEVVQRPSSVVKELLENAIDAGSSTIKLIIKDAGKTLIQVVDDGCGMSVTDARLSFERHATSKITSADDLFNIETKGFRGEALASIAAIAHVELKSKTEQAETGTHIKIEGSEVVSQEVAVTPKGTSIQVKNLFYNIPARRKFLKSNPVETRHIIDEFHRVALAHPNVRFSMFHNGSEVFQLPQSNNRQRIVNIFGSKTNEKLVPVDETTEVVAITGFVGKPEFAKRTRGEQFFFVNDRFIKSAYLNHAVASAFEGLLKEGSHASYFLYLQVDPKSIDINIHPTKTEIKFDDEHTLYAILRSAIKHSLGQFNIAPVLDFEHNANLDTPYRKMQMNALAPVVEVDKDFNPFSSGNPENKNLRFRSQKQESGEWESLYVGLQTSNDQGVTIDKDSIETDPEHISMFQDATQESSAATYQLHRKYVISKIRSGMLVIDQHRAHHRIIYEDILKQITVKEGVSQQLLFPLNLSYSTDEIKILQELKEQLEHTGFVFSKIEDENIEITGVPIIASEKQISNILEQLIHDVENEVPESNFSQTDMLAKSLSRSLCIKSGQSLNTLEQEHLVNSLFACKEPSVTPFNQKTFITMTTDELDKKFM